jgi:hypothetical protein
MRVASLGALFGVAIALLALRFAPRPAAAPATDRDDEAIAGALLPEDRGALREIELHYVASLEPIVADTYRDFLRAIDPRVTIDAIVPRGDRARFEAFFASTDPSLLARTRVVEVDGPITVWSKDRALVAAPERVADRTTLVVPLPPDPKWAERANDWATIGALARANPDRFVVRELPLAFDAGDFAVAGDRVIVDPNLWDKNRGRSSRTESPEAVRALVESLLGRDVTLLGASPGDVPRHHMAMYMTPLPSKDAPSGVLVGDPSLAKALLPKDWSPGVASTDSGDPLVPDFSAESQARFDRAARDLASAGFAVTRVPVVPFDDKTYITYTNGVFESRGDTRTAYVPQYGVPALDDAARRAYVVRGWNVVPVRVRAAWPYHGTLGCLVNVMARD